MRRPVGSGELARSAERVLTPDILAVDKPRLKIAAIERIDSRIWMAMEGERRKGKEEAKFEGTGSAFVPSSHFLQLKVAPPND